MFFSEGEIEKLPKRLQEELELFYNEYEKGHDLYDERKKADEQITKAIIKSLEIYLEWYKKIDKKTKDIMGEAVGEIPIMIMIDKIKLSKELKGIIGPLVDISSSHANSHIDRTKLIQETLQKLQK